MSKRMTAATVERYLWSSGTPQAEVMGVQDPPGVIASADTLKEREQLIREAIGLHLTGARQDGESIPEPSSNGASIGAVGVVDVPPA